MKKNRNIKISIDVLTGKAKIYPYEKWIRGKKTAWRLNKDETIADLGFEIIEKEKRIDVTNFDVDDKFQLRGYGRLLMKMIMALSEYYQYPIELDSLGESVGFYEKMGMKHKGRSQTIMRWRPKK